MLRLLYRSSTPVVTLDEVVSHLRRDDTEEDDQYIEACIAAAVTHVENITGLALADQTWEYFLDDFPVTMRGLHPLRNAPIYLPKPPLLEVLNVWYRDTAGASVELTGLPYEGDSGDRPTPARIYTSVNGYWPDTDGLTGAVRIRFRAGFADESASPFVNYAGAVPELLKQAIKVYAATFYQNRESFITGTIATPIGLYDNVLRQFRVDDSLA
jgi:uncharacterized phiE125 gp8 family phage protein